MDRSTVVLDRRFRVTVVTFLLAEVLPQEVQLPAPVRRFFELLEVLFLRVLGLVVSVCALMSAATE